MGGGALKKYGVFTERKNTIEFQKIGNDIQNKISTDLSIRTEIIKCYHTKPDHGDLDILLNINQSLYNDGFNLKSYIQKTFSPTAINNNGGIFSFDYQNFQIDLIPVNDPKWETAKTYFNYDCIGNIMGKTFHKFGLSYGWDGLFYKFRNFNGINSKNILISRNINKIFEFGGYDYDQYLRGFETLEDIFNFAINSKYFDSEMFKMKNLRCIDRKRNNKRKSYRDFLNYLINNDIKMNYKFKKNKADYLPLINSFFPEAKLLKKLNELKKEDDDNKALSTKFNGNIIMQWFPELKGKELGTVIVKFKKHFGDDYDDYISSSSIDEIYNSFNKIYAKI